MGNSDTEKKILIAGDGSDASARTVQYVAETISPSGATIVLFHVFSKIPESFWDREKEPELDIWMSRMKTQEAAHEETVNRLMQKDRQTLLDHSFNEEKIILRVQDRQAGIARDIVAESRNGYDMIIMGRAGTSAVEGVPVGSVANKVIGAVHGLPICVVAGTPSQQNILLPIDGSESSVRAAAFPGFFRNKSNRRVVLYHAIRRIVYPHSSPGGDNPFSEIEQNISEEARKAIEPAMEAAKDRLVKAGYRSENISIKIEGGVASRAAGLLAEAKASHCGAIVLGRKGWSEVEAFTIGRVCHKVIHKAENAAIWLAP